MILRALMCGALLWAGCTVDSGYLDRDLFPCEVDSDCGEGWGCVRGAPYAADFCAPSCDATTCDGICTIQGERSLCLRGCRIRDDGTTSDCGGEDFSCIRTSAELDGICYPAIACSSSSGCGEGDVCLSDFVSLGPGNAIGDHLYCVPEPAEDHSCPARSVPVTFGDLGDLCLATCDPPDTRCPPGFGCLRQSAVFSDEEVLCFPGLYGVPCDDDTNCVYGRCLATGPSKQCTLSCDAAAELAGGCGNLLSLASVVDALAFECDPSAGESGLCATRSSLGFLCTTPESDAYVCADDLECRSFLAEDGEVRLCTRPCSIDQQCNRPGDSANFCLRGFGPGACLPKVAAGRACSEDNQCQSGRCAESVCTASPS